MKAFQCVSYHRTNAAKVKLIHHKVKAETNPGVFLRNYRVRFEGAVRGEKAEEAEGG